MKTLNQIEVIKETEKAILVKAFVSELEKEMEFWLPKSKVELDGDSITIDENIWSDKIEEFKNPEEKSSMVISVQSYEELENSVKLVLDAKLGKISLSPWFYVPKSLILSIDETDSEEEEKYQVTIQDWFWEKAYKTMVESQLEFYNKEREEENLFSKKDFKLLNPIIN